MLRNIFSSVWLVPSETGHCKRGGPMVVSSFSSLQSASVPFRGCVWFPAGGCSRERSRKWNCLLAVASLKKPETGLPIESEVERLLDSVKWDDRGLAVAIAQNVDTGAILMQGFANKDALAKTLSTQKATFYSRSRSTLWTKGETSNNFIIVHDVFFDCDRDSIIYQGKPLGPTCHTGAETCYYTPADDLLKDDQVEGHRLALTTLYSLESTIRQRKAELDEQETRKPSWTKRLLLDEKLLCSKIREEAGELCQTLENNEDKSRTAAEMGDLLYHSMVLLARKNVELEEVLEILRHRFSQSGIEEKRGRPQKD